jgi:hypothetical protein
VTWWEAVLYTLAIIGFWAAYCVIGDIVDRWFQRWQAARLQHAVDELRTIRRESTTTEETDHG